MDGINNVTARTSISVSATSIGKLLSNILLPRCNAFFERGEVLPFTAAAPFVVRQAGAT